MKGKYNGQTQWQTSLHDSLPTSWRIERVKSIASKIGSGITPEGGAVTYQDNGIPLLRSQNIHFDGIRLDDVAYITQETHDMMSNSKVYTGDVLLNITGASIGRCSYVHSEIEEANVNQHVCIIRPDDKVVTKYLCYFLSSSLGQEQIFYSFTGSSREGLSIREIGQFRLIIPLSNEQRAIAAYLDKTCAAIDKAIEAKQKQLEILDALRKSIIHKAVTRGLDDSVELKDSGVEWLGRIPKHWNVKRIKRYAHVKRGASPRPIADQKYFDDDGEYAWVRITDVSASGRYLEKTTQTLSELGASLSVKQNPGDLFISIAGTVGKPIITKIKCCIHDGFIWFDNPKFNKDFLYYIFLSEAPYQGLGKLGTQLNLNTDTIGQIFISAPSKKEQRHIVDYLDKKCSELTDLQENIKDQISTLQQYRKSLIHECVTGKQRITEEDAPGQL